MTEPLTRPAGSPAAGRGAWRRPAVTVVGVLAPAAVLVGYLALRSHVPDPLPTHWGLRGEVNHTASVTGFATVTLVIAAALAVAVAAAVWLAHTPIAGRMLAGLLTFGAWLVAGIAVTTFVVSRGAADAHAVAMPWYDLLATTALPALIGFGAWSLMPAGEHRALPLDADGVVLAPGERVVWIGHEHSTAMRWVAVVVAAAGAALLFVTVVVGVVVFLAGIAIALASELAVRIDGEGVHTLWGPFGWPRPRIALSAIASVHAEQIEPMQWGGWGYRVSTRGVAAVIRRGPGLVIERVSGPTYAVTVPDAARGAAVLSALVARERGGGGGGGAPAGSAHRGE